MVFCEFIIIFVHFCAIAHNVPAVWSPLTAGLRGFDRPDKQMRSICRADKMCRKKTAQRGVAPTAVFCRPRGFSPEAHTILLCAVAFYFNISNISIKKLFIISFCLLISFSSPHNLLKYSSLRRIKKQFSSTNASS